MRLFLACALLVASMSVVADEAYLHCKPLERIDPRGVVSCMTSRLRDEQVPQPYKTYARRGAWQSALTRPFLVEQVLADGTVGMACAYGAASLCVRPSRDLELAEGQPEWRFELSSRHGDNWEFGWELSHGQQVACVELTEAVRQHLLASAVVKVTTQYPSGRWSLEFATQGAADSLRQVERQCASG